MRGAEVSKMVDVEIKWRYRRCPSPGDSPIRNSVNCRYRRESHKNHKNVLEGGRRFSKMAITKFEWRYRRHSGPGDSPIRTGVIKNIKITPIVQYKKQRFFKRMVTEDKWRHNR